jgi:hypothetical protein
MVENQVYVDTELFTQSGSWNNIKEFEPPNTEYLYHVDEC